MLFVNDLYTPGVPKWLVHTAAQEDGMGLADWVFPGFFIHGRFVYSVRLSGSPKSSRLQPSTAFTHFDQDGQFITHWRFHC